MTNPEDNPWLRQRTRTGDEYEEQYERAAAAGENVHGEADFVQGMRISGEAPRSVLDAGCGTGRVARELARRGLDVVGVDLDDVMLATARAKAPDVAWHTGDLSTIHLGRKFDAIVMPGNVMIFLTPGTEAAVVANLAAHLSDAGVMIAGFKLFEHGREAPLDQLLPGSLTLDEYDAHCAAAGLKLKDRYATWDRDPWQLGGGYAVSVHTNEK